MSFVNSLIGGQSGNTGGAGLNYQAGDANLINPVSGAQAQRGIVRTNNSLDMQKNFLQAVNQQNGLGNQSNVYNQMQGVVNGTGPNPAQAQLAQATQANVANQAAQAASQRGGASNVGMMSRQAANQGANIQQQSAGQAATLQAQQSLGALNQMGNIANTQAAQQAQAVQGYGNSVQNQQQQLLNAIAAQNNARVGNMGSQNSANASISGVAAQGQQQLLGNLMSSAGSAMAMAEGGLVPDIQQAPPIAPPPAIAPKQDPKELIAKAAPMAAAMAEGGEVQSGPMSKVGQFLKDMGSQNLQNSGASQIGSALGTAIGTGIHNMMQPAPQAQMQGDRNMYAQPMMASGGKVPALVSPGERYLNPSEAKAAAEGKVNPMKAGEKIPGKPKIAGDKDSYSNDTVKKSLSTGGIVIPRSITQGSDAEKKAMEFVKQVFAKKNKNG